MLRYLLIFNTFTAFCATEHLRGVGPGFPATKGEVWPKPQHQVKKNVVLAYDHVLFEIKVVGATCPLLTSAVERYTYLFARRSKFVIRSPYHTSKSTLMSELRINLTGPCEKYPHFGMDETYKLSISQVSTLESSSIWGILRGLQTVLHSFYLSDDYRETLINATDIVDFPRFSHRGLLLDTARHYISLQNILVILEAMEMNKMNVFHWHIVDDESFPYQSEKFPELSKKAAYYPTMVYSKQDIKLVLKYARERGIRVIPEFDVPGHTLSWGESHPEILAMCVDYDGNSRAAMNPVKNATFDLLKALFKEVQDLFPDKSFHLGGDEVFSPCWYVNPSVQAYIKQHNMKNTDLLPMFMNKLFALLDATSQPIVWQEVFESMPLSPNIPVQIWKSDPVQAYSPEQYSDNGKKNLNKVLDAGNKAILSAPWYLSHLNKGSWDFYYGTDPATMVVNKSLVQNVLGGEACMWGGSIDNRNVISRIWPRASTIAEILWSSPPFDDTNHEYHNRNRLEEHTCRMIRYNIGAQPPKDRPGFCVDKPKKSKSNT